MYLVYCVIGFSLLSYITVHRRETLILTLLYGLLYYNRMTYTALDTELYIIRSNLAFLAGIILTVLNTKVGIYQAVLQLLILCAYGSLAYDVSNESHIIIYNNFEEIIYALVMLQFIGFIPFSRLWRLLCYFHSNYFANIKYHSRNQKI